MPKNIFTFLPFVALPADRPEKYLQNRCSYVRRIYTKKIGLLSELEAEKITFPPKPERRTDISYYRVY